MSESQAVQQFLLERSHDNFNMVVDENFELIKKVVFRLLLNEDDALDVVQETFITAYQKVDQFKGNAKFSTWLCKIAHNNAYSFLRKRKLNCISFNDLLEPVASKLDHPDSKMHREELQLEINNALSTLTPELRATLLLITVDEVPIDEAVEILNCNKATIYWRIHKARKMVKKALGRG